MTAAPNPDSTPRPLSIRMNEDSRENTGLIVVLLVMTGVTGIVDAVSYLGLGHIFTANMTGNVVLMGFGLGGVSGISLSRSVIALFCFMLGAVAGGRMGRRLNSRQSRVSGLLVEAALLFVAAAISFKAGGRTDANAAMLDGVVASTAIAMGLRNAVVRKLGVADLTTTVLTLTIAGLAADSALAGDSNPRWRRRCAAILCMLAGAAAGAVLLRFSLTVPLLVSGAIAMACALARLEITHV
jgi:uncharacterized membrane protein YoaK (UPF0700 family)